MSNKTKKNGSKLVMLLIAVIVVALFALVGTTHAATQSFTSKYAIGMKNSDAVRSLQSFLQNAGFYSGPVTGNYLSQTAAAVASFQKANGIAPASGLFGPATRAVANVILATGVAPASKGAITSPVSGTVEVGQTQNVAWTANGINSPAVSVNIIKKVSDKPAVYKLVRTVSARTTNDGKATWVPAKGDVGTGLSVEIGCTSTKNACTAIDSLSGNLAVVNSARFANTASAYQAIEAQANK